jgi:hypothetical protein
MSREQNSTGLAAIYARLDEIHMTEADRQTARAALAQADALVDAAFAVKDAVARLFRARSLAHGQA